MSVAALVSVVIINWNGLPHLATCLPCLMRQTYAPFEVLVVDNASQDGSQRWLADNFSQVKLIANAENVGFAAANNQGIQAARGVLPTHQRLKADNLVGLQCDNRLIDELKLAPFERVLQVGFQLPLGLVRLQSRCVEELALRPAQHAGAMRRRFCVA